MKRLLPAWALCLASAAALFAQAPLPGPPTQTFRSETRLVPVDVRVVDRNRKPVTDLTAADFTILEDGVRQDIRQFFAHAFTPDSRAAADPTALGRLRTVAGATDTLAPENRRVFLILFGRGEVQGPGKGIDGVLRFVRDLALPQDLIAVLAWNRATEFTTDHAKIAGVIERFKRSYRGIDTKLRVRNDILGAVFGNQASKSALRISPELQAEIDVVMGGTGAVDVRTVVAGRSVNGRRINDDSMRANDELQAAVGAIAADEDNAAAQFSAQSSLDEFVASNLQTMEDLGNLYLAIDYLRNLQGEKHLVFLSETGLALPRPEDDRDLARAAATGRVAIDYIHAGGQPPMNLGVSAPASVGGVPPVMNPRMVAPVQSLFASRTARTFATLTGGTSYWNQLKPGDDMAVIDGVNRFQYVLGYYPSRPADGRFHTIAVRVNRPGVTVSYRHGYDAAPQPVVFDRERVLTNSRISTAATLGDAIRDIPIRISAAAAAREVKTELRVDPRALRFSREGVQNVASVVVAVWYFKGNDVIRQAHGKVLLAFTDEELRALAETGIPISLATTVETAASDVKVVLYQYAADRVGSAVAKVQVAP